MKKLSGLAIGLMLVSCCSRATSNSGNLKVTEISATPSPISQPEIDREPETDADKPVPEQFRNADFKNVTYPVTPDVDVTPPFRLSSVRLKDGSFELLDPKGVGGLTFDLQDIDYVDLTGDGKEEAIVQLSQLVCGGSCDGSSAFFYFYSAVGGRAKLLSRIETGSMAYDCGLKSFVLKGSLLTLETFRNCRFDGVTLKTSDDADLAGGKFITREFTRLHLKFNGQKFVLQKRELLPNPNDDISNYSAKIEMRNE